MSADYNVTENPRLKKTTPINSTVLVEATSGNSSDAFSGTNMQALMISLILVLLSTVLCYRRQHDALH